MCASIVGRNLLGVAVAGDFELVALACGLAVALFMPWCQWQRGHIAVDAFTQFLPARHNARLDRLGAGLLGGCFSLLAWRTGAGALNAWTTQAGSMLMGFPEWLIYAGMVPPFALTALIAIAQARWGCALDGEVP